MLTDKSTEKERSQIHKSILNIALIEAGYKLHAGWYLVLERLLKMYPGSSASWSRKGWKKKNLQTVFHENWRLFIIYSIVGHLSSKLGTNLDANLIAYQLPKCMGGIYVRLWSLHL